MKCELCQVNEVTRVIRKNIDGTEQDVFVCNQCAMQETSGYTAADTTDCAVTDGVSSKVPNAKVFMDATIRISGAASGRCCPKCGFTVRNESSYRHLGCPECYKIFGREIAERNFAAGYSGKRPQPVRSGVEIISLKSKIEAARREQRFDDVFRLKLALEDVESRGQRFRRSEGEL
ncbi:MAG: hypothetical protein R6V06_00225 [Kiritimatiellia bacterium]